MFDPLQFVERRKTLAKADLEARIALLEAEVARLRAIVEKPAEPTKPSWMALAGKYADDPTFDEAMRLGREWRELFRPKPRKRKKV